VRSIVLLLPVLALIGGCDRPSTPQGQATATPSATVPDVDVANGVLPSAPGKDVDVIGKLDRSHKGAAAPTAEFAGPGARALTIASFKGKPVLVNLWATWCGPCVGEMPTLDRIAAEGKVQVVLVSQDLDGAAKVTPYFAKAGFKSLGQYLDPGLKMSAAFNNPSLPTSILYDSQGKEVWRMIGGMDWTSPSAHDLLAEAK
jgi:thiol-disulfide isomerase/thioredoxin